MRAFLYSRGETIYAGTSEVQRNTLARFIGLPGGRPGGSQTSRQRPRLRGGASAPSDDARMLREGLEELLASELTPARHSAALEGPAVDRDVWQALGTAGWLGLACEKNLPGGARALVELAECAGGRRVPGPLGLTLAITAPLLTETPGGERHADPLREGELLAALVMPDAGTPGAPRFTALSASRTGSGTVTLSGRARGVRFAAEADLLTVPFELDARVALAVRRAGSRGNHCRRAVCGRSRRPTFVGDLRLSRDRSGRPRRRS